MHPNSLENTERNKYQALDAAPGELGKVIGCRFPRDVEAQLTAMTPAERSAFIRRWVAYGLRAEAEEPQAVDTANPPVEDGGRPIASVGLSPRALALLQRAQVETVEDLTLLGPSDLLEIRGLGAAAQAEIVQKCGPWLRVEERRY